MVHIPLRGGLHTPENRGKFPPQAESRQSCFYGNQNIDLRFGWLPLCPAEKSVVQVKDELLAVFFLKRNKKFAECCRIQLFGFALKQLKLFFLWPPRVFFPQKNFTSRFILHIPGKFFFPHAVVESFLVLFLQPRNAADKLTFLLVAKKKKRKVFRC